MGMPCLSTMWMELSLSTRSTSECVESATERRYWFDFVHLVSAVFVMEKDSVSCK